MRSKFLHQLIIQIILSIAIHSVSSAQKYDEKELQRDIRKIFSSSHFQHTQASVKVLSLEDGKSLFDFNSNLFLRPASNTKLFTSAAAILSLDSGYKFETSVYGIESAQREGAWNLYIKGAADPLFTIKDIQKLVENISRQGMKRIDSISLDESMVDTIRFGKGWMWDDEPEAFQPFLSAFPIEHNTMKVHVTAENNSIRYSLTPDLSMFTVNNTAMSGRNDSIVITRLPDSHIIFISGTMINGHSDSAELSLWNTPEIFFTLFVEACLKNGITVYRKNFIRMIVPAYSTFVTSITRNLDEVLHYMNKKSDNLSAELVLKSLAHSVEKSPGRTMNGISYMRNILAKQNVDTSAISIVDGSGISFLNLTTTECIAQLLYRMSQTIFFNRYKKTLAIGSTDGTLKNRLKGNQNGKFVYAKTGTLSGISNLSGYVIPPDGIPLCFSIFIQNFTGNPAPYRQAQDEIVSYLLRYSMTSTTTTHSR